VKQQFPSRLASFVSSLRADGASVAENEQARVTLQGLTADNAGRLFGLLAEVEGCGRVQFIDAGDNAINDPRVDASIPPLTVSFEKPHAQDGPSFLTLDAFRAWLVKPTDAAQVWVASCLHEFRSEAHLVSPWGEAVRAVSVAAPRKSPRKLVRDTSGKGEVPNDIRPYFLATTERLEEDNPAFQEWAAVAADKLTLCVTSEVTADSVSFIGPPRVSFLRFDAIANPELAEWFFPLQEAAQWIYDIEREAELRLGLFAREFARIASSDLPIGGAVNSAAASALEASRIAYQYSVSDLGKEALKGLADLRKTVVDDIQKLAESMRQIASNAAGALFYSLGIIAAKLSTPIEPLIFDAMLVAGFIYVLSVLLVSERYLLQQRTIRSKWRAKLYRYLTSDEYKDMVENPTNSAEGSLYVMLWVVFFLACSTFFGGVLLR
jgi:hypothetical protein